MAVRVRNPGNYSYGHSNEHNYRHNYGQDGIQMDSETGQVVTHGVTKLEVLKIVVTDTTVEIITTTEHDNVMGMDTECQVLAKLWFLLE